MIPNLSRPAVGGLCILSGLLFGSFLNVCISRLPRGESIVRPRSRCRSCGHAIANRDNIPVLSWILLGAKCRSCRATIPWRYPLVEIATSLLFLGCWLKFGLNWTAVAYALLCFLLLGLAAMDAETMLLPDTFTLSGLVLGILISAVRGASGAGTFRLVNGLRTAGLAMLAAGIAAAFLLLILVAYWIVRRQAGVGLGDVKLLAMIAAWMGLAQTGLVFVFAVTAGAVYGVAVTLLKKSKDGVPAGQQAIPLGVFLSAAGIYGIFLGEETLRWYLQFFP